MQNFVMPDADDKAVMPILRHGAGKLPGEDPAATEAVFRKIS